MKGYKTTTMGFIFTLLIFSWSSVISAAPILLNTTVSPDGRTYALYEASSITWNCAEAFTQSLGSGWNLATITSQEEQDIISGLVSDRTNEFWVGGLQDPWFTFSAKANWTWVTGEAMSFTNWNNCEPNDYYGRASEQYMAVWGSGKWNDEGNLHNIKGFVAEQSLPAPVPEPATLILLGCGLIGLAGLRRRQK